MSVYRASTLCSAIAVAVLLTTSGCGPGDSSNGSTARKTFDSQATLDDASSSTAETTTPPTSSDTAGSTTVTTSTSSNASTSTPSSGWGDLKGTFIYDGEPTVPTKITITKDREFCGEHDVRVESLLVNKENRGLANVVVYLYLKRGEKTPAAHESYKNAEQQVVLDNKGCRFTPHICLVTTSQKLVIGNSDAVGHNTKIDTYANPPSNETIPSNSSIEKQFSRVERTPAPVSCSIHPWMRGYLLVRDSPYFAVTDENGQFEIKNLPSGEWTFQVWHEKASITEVTLDGKKTNWRRGRATVTINGGEATDLGEIKVGPDVFK